MLAVQDRLIAPGIVVEFGHVQCGPPGALDGHRLPPPVAHPRTLLLPRILDVVQAHGLAVLIQLVLHLAGQGQRLRPGQVDAAVLQFAAVQHGYGNQAAGLGLAQVASPLQHGDGPQFRRFLACLDNLPRVLRTGRNRGHQTQHHGNRS